MKLHLTLLEKIGFGKRQLCGCFFKIGEDATHQFPKLTREKLKPSVSDEKGLIYWNVEIANRKNRFDRQRKTGDVMTRTETLSNVVGQVKKSANDWLRARGSQFANFYWQGGYGVFSVSQSAVEEVREYIRNQREHHKRVSFQDEFRAFLKRYEVEFNEQYVWD